jgi:hypothetical protein
MVPRRSWLLAFCFATAGVACHRGGGASASDGGKTQGPEAAHADKNTLVPPIAAARTASGTTFVAGWSKGRDALVVKRLGDAGELWSVDAISGIDAGANAEVRVLPLGSGVVATARGVRGGGAVTEAVAVTAAGSVSGPTIAVGAAACATDDALGWIATSRGGVFRVRSVPVALAPVADLYSISAERDPMLVCGSHSFFALGDGENDTTLEFSEGAPPHAKVVMRERDFADEEREHDTFVFGDTLGLLRVGQSGSLSIRRVKAGEWGEWRRVTARLEPNDEVVAVDGDAQSSLIVFTRDDTGCDGSAASSIHAFGIGRELERPVDLAPGECGKEKGPFWTGAIAGRFVTAWVDRNSTPKEDEPRVLGISYRAFSLESAGELVHVTRAADAIVDAGCDDSRCYAVALARSSDGSSRLEVIAYP